MKNLKSASEEMLFNLGNGFETIKSLHGRLDSMDILSLIQLSSETITKFKKLDSKESVTELLRNIAEIRETFSVHFSSDIQLQKGKLGIQIPFIYLQKVNRIMQEK